MKTRISSRRWDFRFSAFEKGRVLQDCLIAAAILLTVGTVGINRHEQLSCHGFVVVPSHTTTTMATIAPAERIRMRESPIWLSSSLSMADGENNEDTLETLTKKLTMLLSVNDSDEGDEEQKEERRLDLFRTKLSVSTNGSNNNDDESYSRKTSIYMNNARVDTSTIENAGRGLFATKEIKQGHLITCYPGDAIVLTVVDSQDNESANDDIKDRSNWSITWGDHISTEDLNENGIIGDDQVLPDDLLSYMIHAMGDYGVLGLPLYSSRDANDDTAYLGHYANDGASNIPFTGEDLAPYVIESSEVSNAVHKDLCGCHMITVATRDIRKGEEIFVVYGPGYWMDANGIKDYDEDDDDDEYELDFDFDDDDNNDDEERQRAYYDN